jgi:hypothetical protein
MCAIAFAANSNDKPSKTQSKITAWQAAWRTIAVISPASATPVAENNAALCRSPISMVPF